MRVFAMRSTMEEKLDKVICNCCGKEIAKDSYGYIQDYVHIEKEWGYFSNKDGEKHSLDLCEACYDKLLEQCRVLPENISFAKAEK
jgi:hypothetical protein